MARAVALSRCGGQSSGAAWRPWTDVRGEILGGQATRSMQDSLRNVDHCGFMDECGCVGVKGCGAHTKEKLSSSWNEDALYFPNYE